MNTKISNEDSQNEKKHGLIGRPRPPEVREKIAAAHRGKKKNYTSWLKGRTGPDHPSFKHGLGKSRVSAGDQEIHDAWIQGVYRKWNFRCALTGSTEGPFEAHHLNGWDAFPSERYNIENGVLLCKKVHKFFHKLYGNGNNTCLQFDHFVLTHYKDADCEWNNRKINSDNHQPNLDLENLIAEQRTSKQKAFDNFLDLTKKRNHQFVSGVYENIKSEVCVYCPQHDCSYTTTFHNYKRSRTGLPCCGRQAQCSKRAPRDPSTGRFRDSMPNNQ
jgi:hypothetical protein